MPRTSCHESTAHVVYVIDSHEGQLGTWRFFDGLSLGEDFLEERELKCTGGLWQSTCSFCMRSCEWVPAHGVEPGIASSSTIFPRLHLELPTSPASILSTTFQNLKLYGLMVFNSLSLDRGNSPQIPRARAAKKHLSRRAYSQSPIRLPPPPPSSSALSARINALLRSTRS